MKRLYIGVAIGFVLLALSIPLINFFYRPSPTLFEQAASIEDPDFKKVAHHLVENCSACHSASSKLPFYASLPFARGVIEKDVDMGLDFFTLDGKIASGGESFTELDLSRLESAILSGTMAPKRYLYLHWNHKLKQNQKDELLTWIYQERKRRRIERNEPDANGEPIAPLPLDMKLDQKKVALGFDMFHDKRLSKDDTISCASCHDLNKGGADARASSVGVDNQIGPISAPTVFNAVFNMKQFWDGRAADLREQASGPVHNPIEMGSNWQEVLGKLKNDQVIVSRFGELYTDGLTSDNIVDVIVEFERSLVTPHSKFDAYLRGDKIALSEQEQRGYHAFKKHCISCHTGMNVGGLSFEEMGRRNDYFASRNLPLHDVDNGRFNVTKDESDRHRFKVPTLRNVNHTHPYFHDGTQKQLKDAIRSMARYQAGVTLNDETVSDIEAFLLTLDGISNHARS